MGAQIHHEVKKAPKARDAEAVRGPTNRTMERSPIYTKQEETEPINTMTNSESPTAYPNPYPSYGTAPPKKGLPEAASLKKGAMPTTSPSGFPEGMDRDVIIADFAGKYQGPFPCTWCNCIYLDISSDESNGEEQKVVGSVKWTWCFPCLYCALRPPNRFGRLQVRNGRGVTSAT